MTLIRILALSLGALFYGAALAATTPLQDANQLFKQGKFPAALEKVNAYLAGNPKEAQGRFLKGLLLTELNRPQEAIRVFTDLTEDYPELPEPYNNLAVLYAAQGQYDKARNSLEMAIRTHPSYATAHENLGDIYAKMASQSYDKALQLDKGNLSAQTKLSLIKDLFNPATVQASAKGKAKPAKTVSLTTEPTPPMPEPALRDKPPQVAAADKPAEAASEKVTEKAAAEKPAEKPTEAKTNGAKAKPLKLPADPKLAAEKLLQAWADAWSERDADAYLAFYADDFKVPGKKSRAAWAEERRLRVTRPEYIKVELSKLTTKVKGNQVFVTFHQQYESNLLKTASTKRITLEKQGGTWKITEER
ncbi:tetratricopeptide repeat protein [Sulfuritortus calidifontis]|uniref:Tetratricopeptide repeat protein n=1 Tax=Sulfuritortus calidifontis TaxID=1914471 RepID=A0A4V2UQV6_9PROT|nr:nuclear transport factor 2 family protein [Sulfuritortus calidifontis]TCS72927.1 tetratricopeptide repeat protein [Sulfuritortus calidifontis]